MPELRQRAELSFDTIAMPILEEAATVGDIDGLCISADTEHVNEAADFLAYAVSDSAIETVTRTGYIVPANTEVAGSEVFLGPGRQPLTSRSSTPRSAAWSSRPCWTTARSSSTPSAR